MALLSLSLALVATDPRDSRAAGVEVVIDDDGYQPATLTVPAGTTVTWVNKGKQVHSVTHDGNSWDSGGLPPGKSFSYLMSTVGTFTYHSENDVSVATDAAGNPAPVMPLKATIVVTPRPTPTPQPTTVAATATPLPLEATVIVTDSGFQPPTVTIPLGGAVIWLNKGQKVHTSTSDNPMWDTGGIGPGESKRVVFSGMGQFNYHSTVDANPPGSIYYTLIGVVLVVPPQGSAGPADTTASGGQVFTNGVVHISDSGFQPATIRVTAGGSVTWVNDGSGVHTVTHDVSAFDSGGLAPVKSFNQSFPTPGVYEYHSETDTNPPHSRNYTMRARVIVVPPS